MTKDNDENHVIRRHRHPHVGSHVYGPSKPKTWISNIIKQILGLKFRAPKLNSRIHLKLIHIYVQPTTTKIECEDDWCTISFFFKINFKKHMHLIDSLFFSPPSLLISTYSHTILHESLYLHKQNLEINIIQTKTPV